MTQTLTFYEHNASAFADATLHVNFRETQDHTVSILGWIQYEKIKWLQTNNPEVPGLVYKLALLDEKMRRLGNVRKLWEGVLDLRKDSIYRLYEKCYMEEKQ